MDVFVQALITVLCSVSAAVITWAITTNANKVKANQEAKKNEDAAIHEIVEKFDQLMKDHKALMKSQRQQLKNAIVRICEEAFDNGYITTASLAALEDDFESYEDLEGNSFVGDYVSRVRTHIPIVNDKIPDDLVEQVKQKIGAKHD